MYKFDLRPAYDPNLMPHLQTASEIEERFIQQVWSLYKSETTSLLLGSTREDADQEQLSGRQDFFLKYSNPFMLRYRKENQFQPSYCHEENEEEFEHFKEFHTADSNICVWKIDDLTRKPYEVLSSWHQEFEKIFKSSSTIDQQEYELFCNITIYLLCLCIPGASEDPRFNPMQIHQYIYQAFKTTQNAFFQMQAVYPPVKRNASTAIDGNVDLAAKPDFMVYDPFLQTESAWYSLPDRTLDRIKEIFKRHLEQIGVHISGDNFESLISEIVELATNNGKVTYLLPFVCTKIFAEILRFEPDMHGEQGLDQHLEDRLQEEVYNYEVFERLFDSHQRRIMKDEFFSAEPNAHPVIAFMQDIVALIYEIGMTVAKKPEYMIMNQINTNWLTLCLFGTRRYFSDSNICLQFCDLTLPILLQNLFEDEEHNGQKWLDMNWLFYLDKCPPVEFEYATWKKLSKAGVFEFEEMLTSIAWKNQLANYVFNPSVWNESGLTEQSSEFQKEIDDIAQKISVAADILRERNEAVELAVPAIRNALLFHLVDPILDDLLEFLEMLSTPEKQWRLAYMK